MTELDMTADDWWTQVSPRLKQHDDIYLIEGNGLDVFLLRDFLSPAECDTLIGYIDENNAPSKVMGAQPDPDYRTSCSAPLAARHDPLVEVIDHRVAALTGIPLAWQEGLEGQRYTVGQQFKPHFDCFPTDQSYWPEQQRVGGQRTWTVMICLNQPEGGGGTMFPTAGMRIRPRAGNLIAWCNILADGRCNPGSLHCGEPVEAGVKYILTKWHRERPFHPERRFDNPALHLVSIGQAAPQPMMATA